MFSEILKWVIYVIGGAWVLGLVWALVVGVYFVVALGWHFAPLVRDAAIDVYRTIRQRPPIFVLHTEWHWACPPTGGDDYRTGGETRRAENLPEAEAGYFWALQGRHAFLCNRKVEAKRIATIHAIDELLERGIQLPAWVDDSVYRDFEPTARAIREFFAFSTPLPDWIHDSIRRNLEPTGRAFREFYEFGTPLPDWIPEPLRLFIEHDRRRRLDAESRAVAGE